MRPAKEAMWRADAAASSMTSSFDILAISDRDSHGVVVEMTEVSGAGTAENGRPARGVPEILGQRPFVPKTSRSSMGTGVSSCA